MIDADETRDRGLGAARGIAVMLMLYASLAVLGLLAFMVGRALGDS